MGRDRDEEFRAWAQARRAALRRTAFLLTADWFLADDLVQETLTRMYVVWTRAARTGDPTGYARRVLVNLTTDHRRRPSRREQPSDDLPDSSAPAADGSDDRDTLLAALRRVPAGQRACLVLRFWEDLSVEQAATVMGTTPGNVKSQTSRGLETLRVAMADLGAAASAVSGEEIA